MKCLIKKKAYLGDFKGVYDKAWRNKDLNKLTNESENEYFGLV